MPKRTTPAKPTGQWQRGKNIGAGGQGEVTVVTHTITQMRGVMKTPKMDANGQAIARLRREGEILQRLNHPNILALLDTSNDHADPWLITDYIQYGTLHDHAKSYRNDIMRCMRLIRDVAIALQYAHGRGIVHRDVKPKNIFLKSLDYPIVGDWGLAHDRAETSITKFGEKVRSRNFSPPEAELGHFDPEPSFDIFSLGKVLHYIVIGGSVEQRLDHRANPITTQSYRFDDLIAEMLDKACATNPTERYQTIDAFVDELDRLAASLQDPLAKIGVSVLWSVSKAAGNSADAFAIAERRLLDDILVSSPSADSYIKAKHKKLGLNQNAMLLLLAKLEQKSLIQRLYIEGEYGEDNSYWSITNEGKSLLSTYLDETSIYLDATE